MMTQTKINAREIREDSPLIGLSRGDKVKKVLLNNNLWRAGI